ncbi:MAG: hypothetical protein NW207_11315 [Cytophagales bacterium]|nr:hypothetical protein [Cytophagales bacterium]
MWVFRSVLDKRARMITCALHEKLWVAYDANDCTLYKIWNGGKTGVVFDGAVYTSKHGPQPTTQGNTYMYGIYDKPVWQLSLNGEIVENTKAQFKGYVWMNNTVTLKYAFSGPNNIEITIEETPEYIQKSKDGMPGIARNFVVKNIPEGYKFGIELGVSSLSTYTDFVTTGDFVITEKSEKIGKNNTSYAIKGILFFKNNIPANIKTYFLPAAIN